LLKSFFVVCGARRTGIGLRAVHEIATRHPGSWEVAFQDDNVAAVRSGAASRRRSPETPGLRNAGRHRIGRTFPDVWISFNAESREAIERRT
jgi:predicted acetyltransferase